MNENKPDQEFRSLHTLRSEFARVAREDSLRGGRRWTQLRRSLGTRVRRSLAIPLLLIGIAVPAGLAIAGQEPFDFTGGVSPDADLEASPPSGAPEGFPPPVAPPPSKTEHGEPTPNVIGSTVPDQLLEQCEKDPESLSECDLVLAIARGEIEPGKYTDAELERALKAAGYDGDF